MESYILNYNINKTLIDKVGDKFYQRECEDGSTYDFKPNKNFDEFKDWKVVISESKRNAGNCNYAKKQIEISKYFIQVSNREEIENVIMHEISHAITGPYAVKPHGEGWKYNCDILGCDAKRLAKPFAKRKLFKYLITCRHGCKMSKDTIPPNIQNKRCLQHGKYLKIIKLKSVT